MDSRSPHEAVLLHIAPGILEEPDFILDGSLLPLVFCLDYNKVKSGSIHP